MNGTGCCPPTYTRFFPKDVPASPIDRDRYAHEILERFAAKAFRRPVAAETVDRLAALGRRHVLASGTDLRGRHRPGNHGDYRVPWFSLSRGIGRERFCCRTISTG